MTKKMRVVVGMSGGVDSSVAAALLLKQGYEVLGVTLKMWPQDCASLLEDKCCGPQAMEDARMVAARLGIPHYVVDETEVFESEVMDYFVREYQSGRTPNPCVMCNQKLKFGNLLNRALKLGAEYIATGHYARIEKTDRGYLLRRAAVQRKDQSYFLFTLSQEQMSHILMPIGGLSKEEVRALAKEEGLNIHDKDESQDICFVPEQDYATFLKTHLGQDSFELGEIVHRSGKVLGHHQGIEHYTVGQRKGINVGWPKPLYVVEIDPRARRVIVGDDEELWKDEFVVDQIHWGCEGIPAPEKEVAIKIRHSHDGAVAQLFPESAQRVKVRFRKPQRAITPGQAAVFYDEDRVLGGGWITK